MRHINLVCAVGSVLVFSWFAGWYDAMHFGLAIIIGLVVFFGWRRRRGRETSADSYTVSVATSSWVELRKRTLLGMGAGIGFVAAVWLLSLPAEAVFGEPALDEARSRVEHLHKERSWKSLVQASERYLENWGDRSTGKWFAQQAYEGHVRLAETSEPKQAAKHYARAEALAGEWGFDNEVALLGKKLATSRSHAAQLAEESDHVRGKNNRLERENTGIRGQTARLRSKKAELAATIESLHKELKQKRVRIKSLEDLKNQGDALVDAVGLLRMQFSEIAVRVRQSTAERQAQREQRDELDRLRRLEIQVLNLNAVIGTLLQTLSAKQRKVQVNVAEKTALPPGCVGVIHQVEFGGILPIATLSLQTADGKPVSGLRTKDFDVKLDGKQKDLVAAIDISDQVTTTYVILVFDLSNSVTGQPLEEGKKAAKEFMAGLSNQDQVMLITFSDKVRVRHTWTANRRRLISVIDSLTPGGKTALNDAVWLSLDEAAKTKNKNVHVVMISDGQDTASRRSFEETMTRVQRAGVPIFTVGLTGQNLDRRALKMFSSGRFFSASSPQKLVGIYRRLVGQIKNRYRLVVGLDRRDGMLQVTVGGKNAVTMRHAISKKTVNTPQPKPKK